MRFFICVALFLVCMAVVECDRKRYTRHDDDDDDEEDFNRFRRRYRGSASDEDVSVSKSDIRKRERVERLRKDTAEKNTPRVKKGRRFEDTDEDYTSEDLSDFCVTKKGRRCDESTDEDYTDESEELPRKKKVIYIKKFPHEKKKQKQDKETGSILKIHRKAGEYIGRKDDDDVTSEEIGVPKRRRYLYDDDDE